jgi:tRNA 2-thiouridine synthesizing protein A
VAEMKEDRFLDCGGMLCPMPVVRVSQQMATLGVGQVLKVVTTDRGSIADMPAWALDTGNEVVDWRDEGGRLVFYLRKGNGGD